MDDRYARVKRKYQATVEDEVGFILTHLTLQKYSITNTESHCPGGQGVHPSRSAKAQSFSCVRSELNYSPHQASSTSSHHHRSVNWTSCYRYFNLDVAD